MRTLAYFETGSQPYRGLVGSVAMLLTTLLSLQCGMPHSQKVGWKEVGGHRCKRRSLSGGNQQCVLLLFSMRWRTP